MKILIKFPTLGRPKQFFETLYKYYKLANNYKDINCIVSIDENDTTMNNNAVIHGLKTYPNLTLCIDTSNSKIHAINRDISNVKRNWDILLLASDDMVPLIKGYDDIIRNDMKNNFNDLDGTLWYNDGYQRDKLNTLSILGYNYYKRFNYIYYPGYKSVYADNEFTEVSQLLGKTLYNNKVIIEHQHPDYGYNKQDTVHIKNFKNLEHDKSLYVERKQKNFFIDV